MGDLFNQLCQFDTLQAAWEQVLEKNSRGGLDGIQPRDLRPDIDAALGRLVRDLQAQTYIPAPYGKGALPKFNEAGEWRQISLPTVMDKVVQQAFVTLTTPVLEKEFLDCSYAYRAGKGPVKAIKRLEHIIRHQKVRWSAVADIDNFFDSLDQALLLERLQSILPEPELLQLVKLWLRAGLISSRGDWEERETGIAQGAVLSPLLANFYLHAMDSYAVSQKYHYLRYSDNFIILSENKDRLYAAYEKLRHFLTQELRLRLNDNPYPFKDLSQGFVFLGIYFKGEERRISLGKEKKTLRKLDWLTEKRRQSDPGALLKRLNDAVSSSRRYYTFINPAEQFKAFDQHLLQRLKGLLPFGQQRGWWRDPKEIQEFLDKLELYHAYPESERRRLLQELVKEARAPATRPAPAPKAMPAATAAPESKEVTAAPAETAPSAAAQTRRATAQKSRYLRQVMDETEVFVSTPGISVGKTGARIILREQRRNVLECHFQKVRHLSIASRGVSLSSDLILECAGKNIPITFYNPKGIPEAVLHSPMHSLGALSIAQIKAYETDKALEIVKILLTGKIRNQINLIKFYLRHRKEEQPEFAEKAQSQIERMQTELQDLQKIARSEVFSITRDKLFAGEGRISARYWDCVKAILPAELEFTKRMRYQAADLVNNMLNYGYGMLYQRVWRAALRAGLNPHISFLHAFQARKPTLVYDLVEEYRQALVDRPLISLLTRGQKGRDLKLDKTSGLLQPDTRNQVIKAVGARLASLITFRGKKIKAEDVIEHQVKEFVDYLESGKTYRPFIAAY